MNYKYLPFLFPLLYYISGAFYSVTFNIAMWDSSTRLTVAILSTSSIAITFCIRYVVWDITKSELEFKEKIKNKNYD